MRAPAQAARRSRWVARRANGPDEVVGWSLARGAGTTRGFPLLLARSRCVAQVSASVRLRANMRCN